MQIIYLIVFAAGLNYSSAESESKCRKKVFTKTVKYSERYKASGTRFEGCQLKEGQIAVFTNKINDKIKIKCNDTKQEIEVNTIVDPDLSFILDVYVPVEERPTWHCGIRKLEEDPDEPGKFELSEDFFSFDPFEGHEDPRKETYEYEITSGILYDVSPRRVQHWMQSIAELTMVSDDE